MLLHSNLVFGLLRSTLLLQVAFVSGNTYTFVQFFAAGLFLFSNSSAVVRYYPSHGMVRPICVCGFYAQQVLL